MDIKLIETNNGGDLVRYANDFSIIYGLENMPYLAMFGGNVKSSTPSKRLPTEQAFDWWGNSLMKNDSSIQLNSLTERTLGNTSLTSAGRIKIEQAVKNDLEFMKPFADVSVSVTIIATDKITIEIFIKQPDNLQDKEFIYVWDATKKELLDEESNAPMPEVIEYFDDFYDDFFE